MKTVRAGMELVIALAAAGAAAMAWSQPGAPPAPDSVSVAGLAPYERPEGAPSVAEFKQTPEWRARMLRGVSEPVPPTLRFIDSQGAWYTPFDRPGMPGRYDIRGLHGTAAQ